MQRKQPGKTIHPAGLPPSLKLRSPGVAPPCNTAEQSAPTALPRRKHLRRLETIFEKWRAPVFFISVCVRERKPLLCGSDLCEILVRGWEDAVEVHGWMIGRYVVMPDHVHFFASPAAEEAKTLSGFVGGWKYRTQRRIRQDGLPRFAWQREFFDHLLRSDESYGDKWEYVRLNPVRAGLVARPEDWPFQGEIHPLEW